MPQTPSLLPSIYPPASSRHPLPPSPPPSGCHAGKRQPHYNYFLRRRGEGGGWVDILFRLVRGASVWRVPFHRHCRCPCPCRRHRHDPLRGRLDTLPAVNLYTHTPLQLRQGVFFLGRTKKRRVIFPSKSKRKIHVLRFARTLSLVKYTRTPSITGMRGVTFTLENQEKGVIFLPGKPKGQKKGALRFAFRASCSRASLRESHFVHQLTSVTKSCILYSATAASSGGLQSCHSRVCSKQRGGLQCHRNNCCSKSSGGLTCYQLPSPCSQSATSSKNRTRAYERDKKTWNYIGRAAGQVRQQTVFTRYLASCKHLGTSDQVYRNNLVTGAYTFKTKVPSNRRKKLDIFFASQ